MRFEGRATWTYLYGRGGGRSQPFGRGRAGGMRSCFFVALRHVLDQCEKGECPDLRKNVCLKKECQKECLSQNLLYTR